MVRSRSFAIVVLLLVLLVIGVCIVLESGWYDLYAVSVGSFVPPIRDDCKGMSHVTPCRSKQTMECPGS